MDHEEIKAKVNELMHRGFEIPMEKLTPESKLFEELGLDSLDAVDMLVHLEDNLGVKVAGEKLSHIKTLQDVYELVSEAQPVQA
jgi:acyl carrier protein